MQCPVKTQNCQRQTITIKASDARRRSNPPHFGKSDRKKKKGRKQNLRTIMGAEAQVHENREAENPSSMTMAQFLAWKRQKDDDASARRAEAARKRAEDIAAGTVQMNGRELFAHEPWVFDNTLY
ncbi:hypothetical protein RchiOBHm_Chr7g0240051 [Rosa chinensis]|uniref:ZC3H15/TMA46 family C-terminal domain-containing protein n=2 Tax=Rosa chinensis TaxID=74649 RepID=A0A2P6PHW7_ROSCH|nr:hypothetical protein RchiOBHm_Chr7g0240051 [Rosa chinensis]